MHTYIAEYMLKTGNTHQSIEITNAIYRNREYYIQLLRENIRKILKSVAMLVHGTDRSILNM